MASYTDKINASDGLETLFFLYPKELNIIIIFNN